MNFIKAVQHSIFILLATYGAMIVAPEAKCKIKPTGLEKVNVVVYMNGDTPTDILWANRYCSWLGFPFKELAPITVKVGAQITCDENDVCNCPFYKTKKADCKPTFQNVCAQQILGEEEYLQFLCCVQFVIQPDPLVVKGFQPCVDERPGLAEKIASCMEGQGDICPQTIALANAKEVADKGVDLKKNTEPFFFYNDVFDKCISDNSAAWFLQKICRMLKPEIALSISQCKTAMGWA